MGTRLYFVLLEGPYTVYHDINYSLLSIDFQSEITNILPLQMDTQFHSVFPFRFDCLMVWVSSA